MDEVDVEPHEAEEVEDGEVIVEEDEEGKSGGIEALPMNKLEKTL